MDEMLDRMLDIPETVRINETLRAKLNIVRRIRGRKICDQVRYSLTKAVDQEFTECGNEAVEQLCRQMQATPATPASAPPMSANVGNRRQTSARKMA